MAVKRFIGIAIALLVSCCVSVSNAQESSAAASAASTYRATLERYCITCHNEKLKTANLILNRLDVVNPAANPDIWEKVVRKLRTGAMPPAGLPRPDQQTYDILASYLESALDQSAAAHPNPGRPAVHRLNRAEYSNAIRDLFGVQIDTDSLLLPDDAGHGFDNNADTLSVSPLLIERYLSAASKVARLAIGDSGMQPVFQTYRVPTRLMQDERMSEDLPFGSRGGIAVRHHFPLDGEYVIKVRLQRNNIDYIRGLFEPYPLDVRLDGERVKLFTVGGEDKGKSGPIFNFTSPDSRGDPEREAYETLADSALEIRVPVKTGTRLVQVAFLKRSSKREGIFMPRLMLPDLPAYKGGEPAVDTVTIGGPFHAKGLGETASRRSIFLCRPKVRSEEEACARKILLALARRAYRRPVAAGDTQNLLSFYRAGRSEGGFEGGIRTALQRLLVSPQFVFRIERDPAPQAGAPYRISDIELAARLSFFLWSSIPDDELLGLAEQGKLKDAAVLEAQVRRMLADPRSKSLVTNFAGQWLYLRNLRAVSPDQDKFPEYDQNLIEAFQQETELFFDSMLHEDRSVLDLLRADYTFVNDRLARHYGIPGVIGSHFRRIQLRDENRRGLLGQGSILTVTSYANRTAPTIRGKWVLDNLLGTPPPPPPPNVPSLKDDGGKDGRVLTMRQRMEQHRANPVCASCHARMDPLGFALENFDALGRWRAAEGNTPIDASGVLADGTKFQGPAELRKLLLSRPEQFVITATEKLLTYALGRGIEYYDEPVVRKIVRDAAAADYRWSTIILGIVESTPFQMRRAPEMQQRTPIASVR